MSEPNRREELEASLRELDLEILKLLERRATVAQQVARSRTGNARYSPTTDAGYVEALERAVRAPFPVSAVRPIFTTIDSVSRLYDAAPRVSFCGVEGDFSWLAARGHFGAAADLSRAETVTAALDDVVRSRADFAIVPYESEQDGPILPTIQAIGAAELRLIGEREVTETLALVSVTGNPADVEKIYATSAHHLACRGHLEANHPRALVMDVRSPVMAMELATENHGAAAIIPRGLPLPTSLRIARDSVSDREVVMRFGIVSRLPAPRTGHDATALLFSVLDKPGALFDILGHFKERSCNLRRIQSRPVAAEGWDYVFYVEVGGHVTDRPLVTALEGVKREVKMLKIIGSFPLETPERAPASAT